MEKVSGIYALKLNDTIFYIGQSNNIYKRYKDHCRLSNNKSNTKRCNWLSSLIKKGEFPELEILEITNNLDSREIFWIKHYLDLGQATCNGNEGGKTLFYANKVKSESVYNGKWTPLQRFMQMIRQNQKIHKRLNNLEYVKRSEDVIDLLLFLEKIVGKDYLNQKLAKKYG
jgi:hypothetical protein